MSSLRKNKEHYCKPIHEWEEATRILKDGFKYNYYICKKCHLIKFPAIDLQRIQDYKKSNIFFSVEDWALLLLYSQDNYIASITRYMKMLFILYHEFIPKWEIPSENPGFYAYKYGPYSDRIDSSIDFLISKNYILASGRKSSSKELFIITKKGKQKGRKLFNKLSVKQQKDLSDFRLLWDTKTVTAILKYVYSKYEKYTPNSLILDEVFPGRKLNRRRG